MPKYILILGPENPLFYLMILSKFIVLVLFIFQAFVRYDSHPVWFLDLPYCGNEDLLYECLCSEEMYALAAFV